MDFYDFSLYQLQSKAKILDGVNFSSIKKFCADETFKKLRRAYLKGGLENALFKIKLKKPELYS